jgi:anti-sigma regulatory factor (Ser/Thr protein kinase)
MSVAGANPVGVAELRLRADSTQLSVARRYVRKAAIDHGLDADAGYELEYAVNEAVTNAIRHGRGDAQGNIRLTATADGGRLTITVYDCGSFDQPRPRRMSPDLESGRGLELMRKFADELHVARKPGATAVALSKLRP